MLGRQLRAGPQQEPARSVNDVRGQGHADVEIIDGDHPHEDLRKVDIGNIFAALGTDMFHVAHWYLIGWIDLNFSRWAGLPGGGPAGRLERPMLEAPVEGLLR
ncbi:hypothetical protein GEO60473_19790 [Geobacter sp. 60473]|nr:hypothetical protein GEO60473_19790 [Geobacter sp. 60473]